MRLYPGPPHAPGITTGITTLKQRIVTLSILVLLAIAAFAAWQHGDWDVSELHAFIEEHTLAGSIACVGAFAVSTVLPISALPLLPLAARVYGVWTTMLLTATGWWLKSRRSFASDPVAKADKNKFQEMF